MIKVENLSFTYPGAEQASLSNISFNITPGSLVCLLGANGSGKTTLLCLLSGLFNSYAGKLEIAGKNLPDPEVQNFTSYVPQNPDLYLLGTTLKEDLFIGLPRAKAESDEMQLAAQKLLQELGLSGLEEKPLQTLSYGQRHKACLASALLDNPKLLFLDEPFSGLDFPAVIHLRQIIAENKKQGITQIITVHDLDIISDMADEFALLAAGNLLAKGTCEEVFPRLVDGGVRPPCWWLDGGSKPSFL